MGMWSFLLSPHKDYGNLNSKTPPRHNSGQKKVSFNGISFLMEMTIICETEPPVVQVAAALFGV